MADQTAPFNIIENSPYTGDMLAIKYGGTYRAFIDEAGRLKATVTDPAAYQLLNAAGSEGMVIDTTNKVVRPLADDNYGLGSGGQRWKYLWVGAGDSSFGGNVAIGSGKRLYFNGLGGTRYLQDDASNNRVALSTTLDMGNQGIINSYQIRGFGDKWVLDGGGNFMVGGGFQMTAPSDLGYRSTVTGPFKPMEISKCSALTLLIRQSCAT
jgi:hypothetical protein